MSRAGFVSGGPMNGQYFKADTWSVDIMGYDGQQDGKYIFTYDKWIWHEDEHAKPGLMLK